jgi:UDP-N-acetylmuramyl pentapeptide phosphotransferase/UDP-N-acetylglucosamine-1-phosphate transferase
MDAAIFSAIVPAVLAWATIALARRMPWVAHLADQPNERSLHTTPTPRIGGVGILVGAGTWIACYPGPLATTFGCALALWCVSFADDLRGLPVSVRLAAHALAATIVVATLLGVPETPLAALFGLAAICAIAWSTNLFNFMDGADGLAGAMALVGFGTYALAALLAGEPTLGLSCLALASAAAGFLVHNFPPARVFLGDSGSIPLGFLAAALGLHGVLGEIWPIAFPFLVFSPFIVDATVTLVARFARRETVWRAHRNHYYQRLVLSGWTRRRLLFASLGLMVAAALSALVLKGASPMLQCGIILAWSAAYALIILAIEGQTRKMRSAP